MNKSTVGVLIAAAIFCLIAWSVTFRRVDSVADRVSMPGSRDYVVTTIHRIGLGVESMDISYVSPLKPNSQLIAKFGQAEDVQVEIVHPNEITLKMPNLVNLLYSNSDLDNIIVRFVFLPKDDPYARRMYERALRSSNDRVAQVWFKANYSGVISGKGK